jgi:hypothetical protein
MYAAARTIPLALFALGAVYKQATPALLLLGALAGAMQLLDAGIGLFEHGLGKCTGPLFIAFLQFFVVYLLQNLCRSPRKPGADRPSPWGDNRLRLLAGESSWNLAEHLRLYFSASIASV